MGRAGKLKLFFQKALDEISLESPSRGFTALAKMRDAFICSGTFVDCYRSFRTGAQDELGDVKSHPHRKLSVGLVLLLGRDTGHRDVWGAIAHERMYGLVWRKEKTFDFRSPTSKIA